MSAKNGDRSRYGRLRKSKMHDRTRIRILKKSLEEAKAAPAVSEQKSPSKS